MLAVVAFSAIKNNKAPFCFGKTLSEERKRADAIAAK